MRLAVTALAGLTVAAAAAEQTPVASTPTPDTNQPQIRIQVVLAELRSPPLTNIQRLLALPAGSGMPLLLLTNLSGWPNGSFIFAGDSGQENYDFTNHTPTWTAVLSPSQSAALLSQLQASAGVDILTTPSVVTLSGRDAQVKVSNMHHVVTDMQINPDAKGQPVVLPVTQPFEVGPSTDLRAILAHDQTIDLQAAAEIFEFLGYDKSRRVNHSVPFQSKPVAIEMPQPRFRRRLGASRALLYDGQTLAFSTGPMPIEKTVTNTWPPLSGVPVLGQFFRIRRTVVTTNNVLVLVTPTLMRPEGGRWYTEGERARATNSVPVQPTELTPPPLTPTSRRPP